MCLNLPNMPKDKEIKSQKWHFKESQRVAIFWFQQVIGVIQIPYNPRREGLRSRSVCCLGCSA